MELIKDYLPKGIACDSSRHFITPPSLATIHWTGPYPYQSPSTVRNWWLTSKMEASAHFIIKNDICMQCWPLDKVAWHCGNYKGNNTSYGIEIIPYDEFGRFSDASIETCKELLNALNIKQLMRHYDWSGKDCPRYYLREELWSDLKSRLIADSSL